MPDADQSREQLLAELQALRREVAQLKQQVATTSRRSAEAGGASNRHRLELLLQQVPAIVWTTDTRLTITSSTGSALKELGLVPDQLTGTSLYQYLGTSDEAHPPIAAHRRALAGESATYEYEWSGRSYHVRVEPRRDLSGRAIGCIGVALDITDRRLMEIELRRTYDELERRVEERTSELRSIIQALPDLYFRLAPDGTILDYNPGRGSDLYLTPDRFMGRRMQDVLPETVGRLFTDALGKLTATGQAQQIEYALPFGGEERHFEARLFPILTGQYFALVRNITQRARAEQQMRLLQEQLAHVARITTTGEMASGLAHEINQPLTAIANFGRGCLRRLQQRPHDSTLDREIIAAIGRMVEEAQRGGRIVHWMRHFVQKPDQSRVHARLSDLIGEMLTLCDHDLRQANAAVELDLSEQAPPVLVNAVQVQQVILNLIRNSLEAMASTPPGQRRIRIQTWYDETTSELHLRFSDTGPGLTEESAAHLFDPFYTGKPRGMGLGLTISRTIIEMHSGRLWAYPPDGGGAVLEFTLPASAGTPGD